MLPQFTDGRLGWKCCRVCGQTIQRPLVFGDLEKAIVATFVVVDWLRLALLAFLPGAVTGG